MLNKCIKLSIKQNKNWVNSPLSKKKFPAKLESMKTKECGKLDTLITPTPETDIQNKIDAKILLKDCAENIYFKSFKSM